MSSEKPVQISSGEETDSSDETFVFHGKRKADPFFLDDTEGENLCAKKSKIADDSSATEPYSDSSIPSEEACVVVHEDSGLSKPSEVVTVEVHTQYSSSKYVPVDVIDLTKAEIQEEDGQCKPVDVIDLTNFQVDASQKPMGEEDASVVPKLPVVSSQYLDIRDCNRDENVELIDLTSDGGQKIVQRTTAASAYQPGELVDLTEENTPDDGKQHNAVVHLPDKAEIGNVSDKAEISANDASENAAAENDVQIPVLQDDIQPELAYSPRSPSVNSDEFLPDLEPVYQNQMMDPNVAAEYDRLWLCKYLYLLILTTCLTLNINTSR